MRVYSIQSSRQGELVFCGTSLEPIDVLPLESTHYNSYAHKDFLESEQRIVEECEEENQVALIFEGRLM